MKHRQFFTRFAAALLVALACFTGSSSYAQEEINSYPYTCGNTTFEVSAYRIEPNDAETLVPFISENGRIRLCIPACPTGSGCTKYRIYATYSGSAPGSPDWIASGPLTSSNEDLSGSTHSIDFNANSAGYNYGKIRYEYNKTTDCVCGFDIDVFQTFAPQPIKNNDEPLEDNAVFCVSPGGKATFTVDRLVDGWLGDEVYWDLCNSSEFSKVIPSIVNFNPGIQTIQVASNATVGATCTLSVRQGICNAGTRSVILKVGGASPLLNVSAAAGWDIFSTGTNPPTHIPLGVINSNVGRVCVSVGATASSTVSVANAPSGYNYTFGTTGQFTQNQTNSTTAVVTPNGRGYGELFITGSASECLSAPRKLILDRYLTSAISVRCFWLHTVAGVPARDLYDPSPTVNTNTLGLVPGQQYEFELSEDLPGVGIEWEFSATAPTGWSLSSTTGRSCILTVGTGTPGANFRVQAKNPVCWQTASTPTGVLGSDILSLATNDGTCNFAIYWCTGVQSPACSTVNRYAVSRQCTTDCPSYTYLYYVWTLTDNITNPATVTVTEGCGLLGPTTQLTSTQTLSVQVFPCPSASNACYYYNIDGSVSLAGKTRDNPKPTKTSAGLRGDQGLGVSPNPGHNTITITLPGEKASGNIAISDVTGKTVMKANVAGKEKELNVSSLSKGVYTITYRSSAGNESVKFVKE